MFIRGCLPPNVARSERVEEVEELAALGHELEKTAAGVIVLHMGLEVVGQVRNAFRQDRNLDFGRTGVAFGSLILGNDLRSLRNRDWHIVYTRVVVELGKPCILA